MKGPISFLFKAIFMIGLLIVALYFTVIDKSNYGQINNFILFPQLQSNWCWAANVQMIANKFDKQTSQCQLAYEEFSMGDSGINLDNCICADSTYNNSDYNNTLSEDESTGSIIAKYQKKLDTLGMASEIIDTLPEFSLIKNEINKQQPILLSSIGCNSCSIWDGHALTISGYIETPSQKFILINDPWSLPNTTCSGCKYYLSYDALKSRVEANTHSLSVESSGISTLHNIHLKSDGFVINTISYIKTVVNKVYAKFFNIHNPPLKHQSVDSVGRHNFSPLIQKSLEDISTHIAKQEVIKGVTSLNNMHFDKPILIKKIYTVGQTEIYIVYVRDENNNIIATITLTQDKEKQDFYISSISSPTTNCFDWLAPPKELENLYIIHLVSKNQLFYRGELNKVEYIIPLSNYNYKLSNKITHLNIMELQKGHFYKMNELNNILKLQ